jgi:CRP-like cAMP-binding protein
MYAHERHVLDETLASSTGPVARSQNASSGFDQHLSSILRRFGAAVTYRPKDNIFRRGHSAKSLLAIENGIAITYRTTAAGRRAITAMFKSGEILGLNTGLSHNSDCEAATAVKGVLIDRDTLIGMAERDVRIARTLLSLLTAQSRRGEDRIELFAAPATGRVCNFILGMAVQSGGEDRAELPMRRQDMADYLGLTTETFCRAITSLRNAKIIRLETVRRARILNRPALERLGEGDLALSS